MCTFLKRIFEQNVEVPVPQDAKQFVARRVAVPFPHSFEETVEAVTLVSLVPQARVQRQVNERLVNIPVPRIFGPHVRGQRQHVFALPVLRKLEDKFEVGSLGPRVQICRIFCEHIVEFPPPRVIVDEPVFQTSKEIVEVASFVLQQRTDKQLVEVPVPQQIAAQNMAGVKEILEGIMKEAPDRLSPSGIIRRRDAGWRLSLRVRSRRGDAGWRPSPRVTSRRGDACRTEYEGEESAW